MRNQLFGVSLFVDLLPPRLAFAARLLADMLVLLIAAQVIRAAFAQITTARFTVFLSLGWPKWIMAALLAAGMTMVVLSRLLEMAVNIRNQRP
ncbi:TRAP transporter small permease subunit [Nitratireductor sp. GISD-1A_MAKvit]|uniref:TRAP transporter small permease subunit n=1 Tax=Nitratireductor sp. GISD-1A_MAKvit TaxID=3234198 RepID=UPI00346573D8